MEKLTRLLIRRHFSADYHDLYRTSFKDHAIKAGLSHVDEKGRANMVDVAEKPITTRTARAKAVINVGAEAYELIRKNEIKKGDVLTVAQIAGILGAKKTSELIPLCHPLALTKVDVELTMCEDAKIVAECTAKCLGRTGVEMEALTGVSIAALTIYDMCKAVNKFIIIENIHLVSKTGGQSGNSDKS